MRKYSKRELFMRDFQKLLQFCHERGYGVTQGEGYRTKEQQLIHRFGWRFIKDRWKKLADKVCSKVTESQHQRRLADDIYIWDPFDGSKEISDAQWFEVGAYWESLSPMNRWGGRYGVKTPYTKLGWDRWHFERRG